MNIPLVSIRVGIVGAGFIADYHLQILSRIQGIEVVGICDPAVSRMEPLADRWKIKSRARSVSELLQEAKPDVVHILVPPALHFETTRQFLNNGTHVFLEKPMALCQSDAQELSRIATERELYFGINHNWVHQPLFERARLDIAARRIGRVKHIVSANSLPLFQLAAGLHDHWMFAEPTNVLYEQAPHPLSQVCELLGELSDGVAIPSQPRKLRGGQTFFDRWQLTLQGSDASADVSLSFADSFPDSRLHIIGQDGTIHIDQLNNLYCLDRRTRFAEPVDRFVRGLHNAVSAAAGAFKNVMGYGLSLFKLRGRQDVYYLGMKNSIESFYREMRERRTGTSSLQNGLRTMDVLQKAIASSKTSIDMQAAGQVSAPVPAAALALRQTGSSVQDKALGTVLVIGASGFVGRKLVQKLSTAGYPVRVLVRSQARIADLINRCNLEVAVGDVENRDQVFQATRGCESVIHLAAGAPQDWNGFKRLFVDGLSHVADAALEHGISRLFYTSSIAALYLGDAREIVTDQTPPDPQFETRCHYAKVKVLCEQLLSELGQTRKLPFTIFRPGIVIGEGSRPQHLGVGEWPSDTLCVRWGRNVDTPLPFVLVDDVADAFVCAMKLSPTEVAGKSFNLIGDVSMSAAQYIRILGSETQRDFRLVRHSVMAWASIERAKWLIKAVARKPENVCLSWRELAFRTGVAQFDTSETKRILKWNPTSDFEDFVHRGVRAAI